MLCMKGNFLANCILDYCKQRQKTLQSLTKDRPLGLGVIRIGSDPASLVYIQRKKHIAESLGFVFKEAVFPPNTCETDIIHHIQKWNEDPSITGIIVQLPLPPGHSKEAYLSCISNVKDVDGLASKGLLSGLFIPCTPMGCLLLLKYYDIPLAGKHCVVIGRSRLVGLPLSLLLLEQNATVTIVHRYTENLGFFTKQADILCVCAGKAELIQTSHVHCDLVILDVGIHRSPTGELKGDVQKEVSQYVKALTPVPGGVGPMTVACLMWNVLRAGFLQAFGINDFSSNCSFTSNIYGTKSHQAGTLEKTDVLLQKQETVHHLLNYIEKSKILT